MDEDKFKAKLDEVASKLGRGTRVAGDRLTGWIRKVREAWPEVERSFMGFGKAVAASIGAFAKAFREAYQVDQKKDGEGKAEE